MAYRFARICKLFSTSRPAVVRLGIAPSFRWTHTAPACSSLHWGPSRDTCSRLRPQWRKADMLLCRKYGDEQAMTLDQLKESVLNVLKVFDKINPDKVALEANFVNDLGLDSLDIVEIVMAFEDEFGVEIDDEQAEKIFTANDAVELLKNKLDVH